MPSFIYYTDSYSYIAFAFTYDKLKSRWFDFATNDKALYAQVSGELAAKDILVKPVRKHSCDDYKVHRTPSPWPKLIFEPGTYENHKLTKGSVHISEDGVWKFLDILDKWDKDFDFYCCTLEYGPEKIRELIRLLTERVNQMEHNRNFSLDSEWLPFHPPSRNMAQYRRYRRQIIRMFHEFIAWLEEHQDGVITIHGT
jgi:hypothetical protein